MSSLGRTMGFLKINNGENMKQKILAIFLVSSFLTQIAFAAAPAALSDTAPDILKTDQDRLSYAFGLNIGMNFRAQQVGINQEAFNKGLNDALTNTAPAMTPAQIKDALMKFQTSMIAKQQAALKIAADKNAKQGEAFMKDYATQKGVTSLHGGEILYKVVSAGSGSTFPQISDGVKVTYEGKLPDGTVFDSTQRNGNKPVTIPLKHMIPGMQEALLKMPVGSTWEIVVSPAVAYGAMGVPGTPIGPNATLIFNLTLNGLVQSPKTA